MNQLTTTNKHFTLETSIMEKIFDASGYNFHVLAIDGHKYWMQEILSGKTRPDVEKYLEKLRNEGRLLKDGYDKWRPG